MEADRSAPRCSPPASPRTSACSRRSATAGVLVCSDELNHASIIDGCRLAPRRRRGLPPPRPRPPRRAAARPRRPARPRRERHRVLDGRRRRRRRRARRRCAPAAGALLVLDEAHAVLGPARRRSPPDADVLRVGTLLEDARRARRLRRRARRATSSWSRTRAGRTSSRPRRRPPTPRPRSPRCASCCSRPKATRSSPACARTSTGCGPATRRRSCPFVCGDEDARARRRRRAARARPARARDPAADRRAGHLPAARHAVGRAHRRAGRPARSPRSPTCSATLDVADVGMTIVVVAGTGTDIGKTWVTAAARARAARAAASRSPRASRCSRSRPTTPHTDADVLARRDRRRRRTPCARRTAGCRAPMAPPMAADALGLGRRSRSPTSPPSSPRRATPTSCSSRARAACAPRSPPTATPSTLADALRPALVVLVADAGPRHDQPRCASRVDALARAPRSSCTSTASTPTTTCTAATATGS